MSTSPPPQLLEPAFLAPVIHSNYTPHKPKAAQSPSLPHGSPYPVQVHVLSRQHSMNSADYDLQKRMFDSQMSTNRSSLAANLTGLLIQQRAKEQLLAENEHLETLLTPVHPNTAIFTPTIVMPQNSASANSTPGATESGNVVNGRNDQNLSAAGPGPRRAFGEMARDGGFSTRFDQKDAHILPGQVTSGRSEINTAKILQNLHNDDLSDSDSFVFIEDDGDPAGAGSNKNKAKVVAKDEKNSKEGKEFTVNRYGVKQWTNTKPTVGSNHKSLLSANVLYSGGVVDIHKVEEGHNVCLMNVDVVKHMQRGISVIKHGRSGKPHTCQLRLSANCRYFTWESKKKEVGQNVIRLPWVVAVEQGQRSLVFRRNPDPRVEPLSITISYSRPEKYNHVDESDDERDGPKGKGSGATFLPSFFTKTDTKKSSTKRSTWRGVNEDMTLDIVIEDPNDWLVWYHCIKILVDIATTKIVTDDSLVLKKDTSVVLALPILSGFPSSAWIVDAQTGLTVKEKIENELLQEQSQVQAHMALTRKETYKELVRRASSFVGQNGQNGQNTRQNSEIRTHLIQRHESQRLLARQQSQNSVGSNGSSGGNVAFQQNNTQNGQTDPSPASTTLALTRLESLPLSADGETPDYSNMPDTELLSSTFPAPWRGVEVKGKSDIVHPSWLQQLIFHGPKAGRSCPWVRAYDMSTTSSTYHRVIQRIAECQREQVPSTNELGDPLPASELARRERIFKTFLTQAGGLSIMIMRTRGGDVVGGYATAPWVEKWGFYGTPDSFVFSIGQEDITMEVPDQALVNYVGSGNGNGDQGQNQGGNENGNVSRNVTGAGSPDSRVSTVGSLPHFGSPSGGGSGGEGEGDRGVLQASRLQTRPSATKGQTHVVLEERVCQTHIFRWAGHGRFFQFVSQDAFGFGGNVVEDAKDGDGASPGGASGSGSGGGSDPNHSVGPGGILNTGHALQLGSGASQSTGPALTLARTMDVGTSLPCPIFHSPQLTKNKQWDCLQCEVWIPVPKI